MSSISPARIRRMCPKGWDVQPSHPELLERAGGLFPEEQLQPAQAVFA